MLITNSQSYPGKGDRRRESSEIGESLISVVYRFRRFPPRKGLEIRVYFSQDSLIYQIRAPAVLNFGSIAGAGYMLYLIERAKKCLDFSATLYIIHLFICIMYGDGNSEKFPSHDIDQMFDDKESITKKFLAAFIVFHCFGGAEC
ncbi:hypothetical protein V6N11_032184 [Hibiscus sabdariffa]|uniref:Uncharacterized protein n=1 Tax=Hibiscus sabdariffa TaxID=183260 RepID=A0ABR2T0L5_9ROSI